MINLVSIRDIFQNNTKFKLFQACNYCQYVFPGNQTNDDLGIDNTMCRKMIYRTIC